MMTPAEIERLSDLARSREECGRQLHLLGTSNQLSIVASDSDEQRREVIWSSSALTDHIRAALIKDLRARVAAIDAELAQWKRGDR